MVGLERSIGVLVVFDECLVFLGKFGNVPAAPYKFLVGDVFDVGACEHGDMGMDCEVVEDGFDFGASIMGRYPGAGC